MQRIKIEGDFVYITQPWNGLFYTNSKGDLVNSKLQQKYLQKYTPKGDVKERKELDFVTLFKNELLYNNLPVDRNVLTNLLSETKKNLQRAKLDEVYAALCNIKGISFKLANIYLVKPYSKMPTFLKTYVNYDEFYCGKKCTKISIPRIFLNKVCKQLDIEKIIYYLHLDE